jgi:hypothetical protein
VIIFAVAAVVFLSSPVYIFGDSHFALLLSHNILRHGHVRLDEYLARPLDPRLLRHRPNTELYQIHRANGHSYYFFPIGSSVLSIPFVPLLNALGLSPVRSDGGYDLDGELAMQRILASLLMALLASVLFLTARLVLPAGWSVLIAVAGAFGTQIWSTASRVLWSQTWAILLLGVVILIVVASERRAWKPSPVLVASLLSWLYFVRRTYAIVVVTVSVYVGLFVYDAKAFVRYALTGVAWLALLVAYSWHNFQHVLPPYYLHSGLGWFGGDFRLGRWLIKAYATAGTGHLISPSRGLLVYVPTVLFVAYLLLRYRRRIPSWRLTTLALVSIAGLGFVASAFGSWWGGHCYGPRPSTDLVPWLVLLAILGVSAMRDSSGLRASRRGRRTELTVGAVLLILSVAIHARGAWSCRFTIPRAWRRSGRWSTISRKGVWRSRSRPDGNQTTSC